MEPERFTCRRPGGWLILKGNVLFNPGKNIPVSLEPRKGYEWLKPVKQFLEPRPLLLQKIPVITDDFQLIGQDQLQNVISHLRCKG